MWIVLLLLLSCFASAHFYLDSLQSPFVGVWSGVPRASPVGPFYGNLTWAIRPIPGGLLLEDLFGTHTVANGSYQQFWAVKDYILYCGELRSFMPNSPGVDFAPIVQKFYFREDLSSWTKLTWCAATEAGACDTFEWAAQLRDNNTLEFTILLPKPVVHVSVTLFRQPTPVTNFPVYVAERQACQTIIATNVYNYFWASIPAQWPPTLRKQHSDVSTSQLPQPSVSLHQLYLRSSRPERVSEFKQLNQAKRSSSYQFCYHINLDLQYKLEWNFWNDTQMLDIAVTGKLSENYGYVAIGFANDFPGMIGGDIVLSYLDSQGAGCFRTMYAEYFVGLPVDYEGLSISNTSITTNDDGTVTAAFSRPFATGHHPLPTNYDPALPYLMPMFWSIGSQGTPLADCTDNTEPPYHGYHRGNFMVVLDQPEVIWPSYLQC